MRDAASIPASHRRPTSYYAVLVAGAHLPYSVENDLVALGSEEQWQAIVRLVWTGEWEDVIACDYIHCVNGTCENKLIKLANAVDCYGQVRNEDPPESVRDWIENITGDDAFMTDALSRRVRDEQRADYVLDCARGK